MTQYATLKGAASTFVSLTASASANTKGSYTELSASTPFDSALQLACIVRSTDLRSYLVDFAIGAAGAEVPFLSNVYAAAGNDAGGSGGCRVESRYNIPAGSRISARCQSSTGSSSIGVALILQDRALETLPTQDTYGAATGSSRGTTVDPGAAADTYGAYVELTAASSADHTRLTIVAMLNINFAPSFSAWSLNIATGAAGAETVIIPDIPFQSADLGSDCMLPGHYVFDVEIPAGTRIACNAKSDTTDATDRVFDVVVYGAGPAVGSGGGGEVVAVIG